MYRFVYLAVGAASSHAHVTVTLPLATGASFSNAAGLTSMSVGSQPVPVRQGQYSAYSDDQSNLPLTSIHNRQVHAPFGADILIEPARPYLLPAQYHLVRIGARLHLVPDLERQRYNVIIVRGGLAARSQARIVKGQVAGVHIGIGG